LLPVVWRRIAPSTLLGVSVLGYEDQLVEIEGIAAVPGVAEDH
jgi:hypothetical protein